jgi:diguanylate cyclase (GGDEF)-like protein
LSQFLSLKNKTIIKALEINGVESSISLNDLIDLYTQIILEDTNMIDETSLQSFICKRIQTYCDFNKSVKENLNMIKETKEHSIKIVEAVKEQNIEKIQFYTKELEKQQQKIEELEEEIYTDELTGFYNKKYLLYKCLNNQKSFKENGKFFLINIDNLKEINQEYGYDIGETVIRFVARFLKTFCEEKLEIIRLDGVSFLIFINKEKLIKNIEKKLNEFEKMLENKKFKTHTKKIIKLKIKQKIFDYKINENFTKKLKI